MFAVTPAEILADARRKPRAVLFTLAGHNADTLAALLASPAFGAMQNRVPCFGVDLSPALAAAWAGGGGQTAAAGVIARAEPGGELPAAFVYLAGDWYLAPPPKPTSSQLASRANALRMLKLVTQDSETVELEAIFRQDPSLSYQLLRLVNSPGSGLNRRVTSFTQAIVILGRQQLRRWLNLLLFAARKDDPRATMLLARAALRARRMELIEKAQGGGRATQDRAFLCGMFSLLGVLFGSPLDEIVLPLRLDDELVGALCRNQGLLGAQLALVAALENGAAIAGGEIDGRLAELSLRRDEVADIHLSSLAWVVELVSESMEDQGA